MTICVDTRLRTTSFAIVNYDIGSISSRDRDRGEREIKEKEGR